LGTGRSGDVEVLGVMVVAGNGPGPSGSTVVGAVSVGDVGVVGVVGVVGDSLSVGVGSVVVVVVVVYLGRSWTLVRGTHVYWGSGTNPGGTTCAGSWAGVGAGGW
jgi:hypothetical protein